jgi:phosphatidylglycerophosphate synthase
MASNLNPANAITASRFLTLPVFIWAVDRGDPQVATLALFICAVLDLFDGMVARALNCTTPFGEVFDAIADGFCYGLMLLVIVAYGWVPWVPVAVIVALGFVTLFERARYARRLGKTTNYRSWAMEKMVGFTSYLVGFGVAQFEVDLYFWFAAIVMAVIVAHDTKRMLFDPVPQDA